MAKPIHYFEELFRKISSATGMLLNNGTIHWTHCTSIPHGVVFIPAKN